VRNEGGFIIGLQTQGAGVQVEAADIDRVSDLPV
jgi:hypothetical protein